MGRKVSALRDPATRMDLEWVMMVVEGMELVVPRCAVLVEVVVVASAVAAATSGLQEVNARQSAKERME